MKRTGFQIEIYNKETDKIVDTVELQNVDLESIKNLHGYSGDDFVDGLEIKEEHRQYYQDRHNFTLDLDKYAYFFGVYEDLI